MSLKIPVSFHPASGLERHAPKSNVHFELEGNVGVVDPHENRSSLQQLLRKHMAAVFAVALGISLFLGTLVPLLLRAENQGIVLRNGTFVLATFHSFRNVAVYGDDAMVNGKSLLGKDAGRLLEMRSMAIGDDGSLLIAQSMTSGSAIFRVANACAGTSATTNLLIGSEYLFHPYGMGLSKGVLFVTNQNADDVRRFNASTGAPIGVKGFFATIKSPRAVVVAPNTGLLYVASTEENLLVELSPVTGERIRTLNVVHPIGLLYVAQDTLVVGSSASANSAIYWVDLGKWKVFRTLTHPQLVHPAGMTLYPPRKSLLVFSQTNRLILAWDLQEFNATIWRSSLHYRPEGLLTINCAN